MELHEFPRPPEDNGRGVHWSISLYEWGQRDWDFWAEQLVAMKIKWVKLMDDGGGSALPAARRLVDLGIMPVVRLYRPEPNPGNIGQRGRETVKRYVDVGAMYFEANNEPDLDLEWEGQKKPSNWLEIVVEHFVADADIILGQGGYPAVPAFGVGTLRNPFTKIVEMGRRDILDGGAWAALHNYCLARPLEYPNDPVNMHGEPITEEEWHAAGEGHAMEVWEMNWEEVNRRRKELANPDADILTDATCFRAYEQLDAYIVEAIGHSIPIMTTEGGYNVLQRAGTTAGDDPRYAKPTPRATSQMNLEMFEFMQGDREILGQKVPDYYFSVMPWLIAAELIGVLAPPAENQGPWFTRKYDAEWNLDGELPLVQMLKDYPASVRQDGPLPAQWQKPPSPDKLGRDWDYRLNYLGDGVKLELVEPETQPFWKLVQARWLDFEEAAGASQIFVKALDPKGDPLENAGFVVGRGDAEDPVVTKGSGDDYWGNYTMYALLGTYSVEMTEGGHPSERVTGLGLGKEEVPDAWANTAFRLTFQLVEEGNGAPEPADVVGSSAEPSLPAEASETTEAVTDEASSEASPEAPPVEDEVPSVPDDVPPGVAAPATPEEPAAVETAPTVKETAPPETAPPETAPPPEPTEAEKLAALHQAVLDAAQPYLIPLNPDAALYKYGRQHDLGERISAEFTFEHEGTEYAAQAFEKGVVYVPVGQWDQLDQVEREN